MADATAERQRVRALIERAGVAMLMSVDERATHIGRPMDVSTAYLPGGTARRRYEAGTDKSSGKRASCNDSLRRASAQIPLNGSRVRPARG